MHSPFRSAFPWRILSIGLLSISLTVGSAHSADTDAQTEPSEPTPKPAPTAAVVPVPSLHLPDSYVELYKQILSEERSKPRQDFRMAAALSDVALRLWERTHDDAYAKEAVSDLDRALSDPAFSLADFHILHHFGELVYLMKKDNLLTPDQHQKIVDLAKAELATYLKSPDDVLGSLYNIRIAQLKGYAGLLKFLDGEPFDQHDAVLARLNSFFDLLCQLGNTDEDASNYDSLGMVFAIDLARLLGREDDFKAAGFRRNFENYRDIVTPSGLMPEYGDSYFDYDEAPMDRIYLMEYAARFYNDPTFLTAAQKMWERPQMTLPPEDHWIRSLALIGMADTSLTPQPIQGTPSQVLLRNVPGVADPAPDKLILRTGREPGASMIMMDLYASGSHAAQDKGPSIGYYETDQVPLFHNMGRRGTRSAIDGNICWARPPAESFPGLWNHPGQWFTMTIPADLFSKDKDGKYLLTQMSLRNFPGNPNNRSCTDLSFDNLRLEGPAGSLLLDSFDGPEGWRKDLDPPAVTSPDKTEGAASQSIDWAKVKSDVVVRFLPKPWPAPFTKDQFAELKLDIKYEGSRPYILVRGFGQEVEIGAYVLRPNLSSAKVEQRAQDAIGQISYQHYIRDDTTLSRQIVLTAEGYLVVRDVLTPGPSMDGWNAGQLWQLYTLAAQGDHWFCSDDDGTYPNISKDTAANPTRRMLVRFAADAGTKTSVEESKQTYTYPNPKGNPATSFFTAYSERVVHAGHPEVFSMVVVPNDPKLLTPEELAKNIGVTQSPDGATDATISQASKQVAIHIDDNAWSVKRGP